MRVIVAGSRDIVDPVAVATAIAMSGFAVTEVVSGGARGVDQLGEDWARLHGVPWRRFEPVWRRFQRRAGIVRNEQMAAYALEAGGALVAVWDGVSKGTRHMIEHARSVGLPVFVHYVGGPHG